MASFNASPTEGRSHRWLIDTLIHHGLTEPAARAVVALGETLRVQMLQELDPDRRREYGGVLDAQTGEPLGPNTVGARTSVSFAAQIPVARDRGVTSVVGVHTHPGSSAFSAGDAGLLNKDPVIRVMVVIGADGTW
jgi:hypothetical protein